MLLLPITRNQLLDHLPRGGEVVEVGVATGRFSRRILDHVAPRRLHLVDGWRHVDVDVYARDTSNVADAEQEARYQGVLSAFAEQIAAGQVIVHRKFSGEAAPAFADGSLDWVFIDARHDHEGALADLRTYAPKVRPGGFVLGHDYTNHERARAMGFGVIEAVHDFVRESGWHFFALTQEGFPAYLLFRSPEEPAAMALAGRLVHDLPGVVEIRDPLRGGYEHRAITFADGVQRLVPSF